jgi:hypothetical protein
MSFNYILSSDTTFQAVDKINANFSGTSNIWSSSTGNDSIITTNDTNNVSSNDYSFAGGEDSQSNGMYSFTYGKNLIANGDYSFVIGESGKTIGDYSFASGYQTTASGDYSFASGYQTTAIGDYSFASGLQTTASGPASHTQGSGTTAIGLHSFAGGENSVAHNSYSFVFSKNSSVSGYRSAVIGGQNIDGINNDTVYVPSLNIQNLSTVSSPTKILSIDSNGYVKTRDLVIPPSFFQWHTITDTDLTLSLNNGYVSKNNGNYNYDAPTSTFDSYNIFTIPNTTSSDYGKKIKIVNDKSTVTLIRFPSGAKFCYYNNNSVIDQSFDLQLFEYEYIELTFYYYDSSRFFWAIDTFVTNFINNLGFNNTLEDSIGQRIN